MRKELELIKKIEEFLNGELSPADNALFETEIANDPNLEQQVRLQQQILSGIERTEIKRGVKQARIRYKRLKYFYRGGIAGLIVLVIALIPYYNINKTVYAINTLPILNEQGEKNWARADSVIMPQFFSINTEKDTVIETRAGIVLAVPANCFLTNDGQIIKGDIEFVVKEALNAADIIQAGLSTKAGSNLLETGGMFFIDARKDGKVLKIDPKNTIYAQIPTDSVKSNMHLFNGKRSSNGTINWENPKPIDHDLVPIDIESLNFYPPHYLDSLAKWGYDSHNKKFTDSLYYSFAALFASYPDGRGDTIQLDNISLADSDCAIDPAKIKVIWHAKFQKTFLATREFEERLRWIHTWFGPVELDMYVNNLDKPLYRIDSIIASRTGGIYRDKFLAFAATHAGRVKTDSKQAKKLSAYYAIKSRAFKLATAKAQHEFWKKQHNLDNAAAINKTEYLQGINDRNKQNFTEEVDNNLKVAYRQLGYRPTNLNPPSTTTYDVVISSTGWHNIDRYVYESVVNKSNVSLENNITGKSINIKYTPVSFQINKAKTYDKLNVYLLPDKLSSFILAGLTNGLYTEKLNSLLHYNMSCIAYKNEQAFIYQKNGVEAKAYADIDLKPVNDKDLIGMLNKAGGKNQGADLVKENKYQRLMRLDEQRQKENMNSMQLNYRLRMCIFACSGTAYPIASKPVSVSIK
jgi:hypothetical protein